MTEEENSGAPDRDAALPGLCLGFLDDIHKRKNCCSLCCLIIRFADIAYPEFWEPDYLFISGDRVEITAQAIPAEELPDFRRPAVGGPTAWYIALVFSTKTDRLVDNGRYLVLRAEDSRPRLGDTGITDDNRLTTPMYSARPMKEGQADLNLVKEWLQNCERYHTYPKCMQRAWSATTEGPGLQGQNSEVETTITESPPVTDHRAKAAARAPLRVIDVETQAIVEAPHLCRYVTLSYVWGWPQPPNSACKAPLTHVEVQPKMFRMTREAFLADHGALPLQLPRTIEDAMFVLKELGEKYLWVDALCIFQDDLEDIQYRVSQMDMIYGAALVTLVAAHGADANTGLLGVRKGSRDAEHQCSAIVDGVRVFISMPMLEEELYRSQLGSLLEAERGIWMTRGWCYQEGILSPRCLIFTRNQIFWKCSEELLCESIQGIEGYHRSFQRPAPYAHVFCSPVLASPFEGDASDKSRTSLDRVYYILAVEDYSSRGLTFESDALNAFSGIIRGMERSYEGRFVWGLPEAAFDLALLWRPLVTDSSLKRRKMFRSWSWPSCSGGVTYQRHLPRFVQSTIFSQEHAIPIHQYSIEDALGHLRQIMQPDVTKDEDLQRIMREISPIDDEVDSNADESPLPYKTEDSLRNAPKTNCDADDSIDPRLHPEHSHILNFQAPCARFPIYHVSPVDDDETATQFRVRSTAIDRDSTNDDDVGMKLLIDNPADVSRLNGQECDFVLLSRWETIDAELLDREGVFKEQRYVNVMLVERKPNEEQAQDDGESEIWYRLGVGTIPGEVWRSGNPWLKSIRLG